MSAPLPPTKPGKEFMEHVFEVIKHGDQAHQDWLKAKCESLVERMDAEAYKYALEVLYDTLGHKNTR